MKNVICEVCGKDDEMKLQWRRSVVTQSRLLCGECWVSRENFIREAVGDAQIKAGREWDKSHPKRWEMVPREIR